VIYEPGTLKLEQSHCKDHIASPDVHVDQEKRQIRMYYHGVQPDGRQHTKVAVSLDGLNFTSYPDSLGLPYFRVFRLGGDYYALAMPGVFYRSRNALTGFEPGPRLFTDNMRHSALLLVSTILYMAYRA